MKVINTSSNLVVNSTPFEKHQFGIKSKNLHYIIGLLRNDLYSDKLLAVIREYACNAYDANVSAGKSKVPVHITLPSKLDSTFKCRDYGEGLSKQDIVDIFISYAESTKRNSDRQIGQMGIGSKSAFCYGDSFLVASYNGGTKTVYNCVLDKDDVGDLLVILEEPMKAGDEDGIEISVNIKKDDVETFRNKALDFFRFWNVLPEIDGFTKAELEKRYKDNSKVLFSGTDWTIYEGSGRSYGSSNKGYVVMGNIAYKIDWENVKLDSIDSADFKVTKDIFRHLIEYFEGCNLVIHAKIGEVQFAPSREALQYTDRTNSAIIKRVRVMLEEIQKSIQVKISGAKSLSDAFTQYGKIFDYYGGLNNTAAYFKDKLVWNGVKINSNGLTGFSLWDAEHGFKAGGHDKYNNSGQTYEHTPILTRFHNNGSTIRAESSRRRRNVDEIQFSDGVKIMLYDTEKKSYIRKAIKYIFNKDSTTKYVYVFQFNRKAIRDAAAKAFHFDKLDIIKYSDIHDIVKKSIIRTGRTVTRAADSTVREAKYITPGNHATSWHSFKAYRDWTNTDIDLSADEGYYLPLANNDPVFKESGGYTHINSFCTYFVKFAKKTGMKVDKLYGFGPRITESKLFDATKWTNAETFVSEKLKEYIADPKFLYYIAWNKVVNKESYWKLTESFLKKLTGSLKTKNTDFHKLLAIASALTFKDNELYEVFADSALYKTTPASAEYKEIKSHMDNLIAKYPLLNCIDDFRQGERMNPKNFDAVVEYIDLIG